MSPCRRSAVATPPPHGELNNESERTGTIDGDDGSQTSGVDAGAGGGVDGGVLPPGQAHLEAVSGRRRRGLGASAARPAQRAAQTLRPAGASAGEVCGGALRGLRPDAHGRASGEGKAGGGSRDAAALAAGGGPTHGAPPQASAPAMARAQAQLRGDGAEVDPKNWTRS